MELKYDPVVDAVAIRTGGAIQPGTIDDTEQLDADRLVHYDVHGNVLKYEFLNAKRYGVRLDDLEHREELAALFAEAGFSERDWSHPIPTKVTRHRGRTSATG